MANKRIHLTYLWSDETVLREDLKRKVSSQMTDWASAFYKRFGFDLDIEPKLPDRGTFAGSQKYALMKSGGVTPDMRDPADVYAQEHAWLGLYQTQLDAADKAQRLVERRLEDLKARVDALKRQLALLRQQRASATDPGEGARLDGAIAQAKVDLSAAEAEEEKSQQELHKLVKTWLEVNENRKTLEADVETKTLIARGEYKLRAQMAMKYRNDSIGSDTRLNVVFCKFRRAVRGLRMRPGPFGVTFSDLKMLVQSLHDEIYIWGGPFVIVNLGLERTHVIAHEVVHAAGHNHPYSIKIYRQKPVRKVARTTIAKGSISGFPFTDVEIKVEYLTIPHEEVPGGAFDGPANDIMSYALEERDPANTILSEKNQKALERAPFVI